MTMDLGNTETVVENDLDGVLWRYFFRDEAGRHLAVNVRCSQPAKTLVEALQQRASLALLRARGRPQAATAARHAPPGVATITLRVSPTDGGIETLFSNMPPE
jgi:hypothetical protein